MPLSTISVEGKALSGQSSCAQMSALGHVWTSALIRKWSVVKGKADIIAWNVFLPTPKASPNP
ncbi:MAG: hypothetical protein NZ659_00235, partial [Acidimicrobiales bacterium]|nr:hypothetical protein [Acidimicrobiales bacterium]